MITNVWAVLCAREVPVTAHSEALCDQEPPSPPRPPPRPHDQLWEQRLRTKGPASHQGQDAQNSKFYCFAHVNGDPFQTDHHCKCSGADQAVFQGQTAMPWRRDHAICGQSHCNPGCHNLSMQPLCHMSQSICFNDVSFRVGEH